MSLFDGCRCLRTNTRVETFVQNVDTATALSVSVNGQQAVATKEMPCTWRTGISATAAKAMLKACYRVVAAGRVALPLDKWVVHDARVQSIRSQPSPSPTQEACIRQQCCGSLVRSTLIRTRRTGLHVEPSGRWRDVYEAGAKGSKCRYDGLADDGLVRRHAEELVGTLPVCSAAAAFAW